MAARRACRALWRRQHCWMATAARARLSSAPPPGSNSCQVECCRRGWDVGSEAAMQQQRSRGCFLIASGAQGCAMPGAGFGWAPCGAMLNPPRNKAPKPAASSHLQVCQGGQPNRRVLSLLRPSVEADSLLAEPGQRALVRPERWSDQRSTRVLVWACCRRSSKGGADAAAVPRQQCTQHGCQTKPTEPAKPNLPTKPTSHQTRAAPLEGGHPSAEPPPAAEPPPSVVWCSADLPPAGW